jgi:hypothetical protein
MRDHLPEDEDRRLALIFQRLATPVADEGFTESVMRGVARRVWRRRIVLGAAALAGIVIALGPFTELVVALSRELSSLSAGSYDMGWLMRNPALAAVALAALLSPAVLGWLEE